MENSIKNERSSIEEDIKILEEFKTNGYTILLMKYGDRIKTNFKLAKAIEHILSDYKRVLKENEILKEEKEQAWEEWNNLEQESYETKQKLKQQIKESQKENEELKEKENKIYKEVQESLAFEKFLIVKERKPDLFNQGRFYISQIIYDILNDVQNPEGIHKENKCIQYIDYIPVQIVKDKIEELNKAYEDSKDENGESEYYYPDYTIRVLEGLLEKRK